MLVIVAAAVVFGLRTRPLEFDSESWRSGDPRIRFRMKDALLAKHAEGKLPTREIVDRLLGPDDYGKNRSDYRYFRMQEWYGNPWYMRIQFDEQGRVLIFSAHPE